ncbi:alpha/beta hydrolase [Nocardia caishijiensis]|uniref:Alpha/beta hydrolase family protein n=1 Tax=Nocardia caishijiensis TaxID=184756 RepID=A0ABQ6YJ11_9NOCA|nr:alpha/beta hydrolase [Nocardia caishijiensis]KAF0845770.1 alpha/beta hydrolase family protein [Nocardia caishijiensis]
MRPTIPQLDTWKLDAVRRAAEVARANADTLSTSVEDCSRALSAAQSWHGRTKEAATQRIDAEVDHGYEVRAALLRIADDAAEVFLGLQHARRYVLDQRTLAVSQGFSVSPDGAVSHGDPEKDGAAGVFQLNLRGGLDEIERLDTLFGSRLREAVGDLTAIRDGQPDVALADGSMHDPDAVVTRLAALSPDERAALLAGLSSEAQRQLVIAAPEVLGNLNGVPFAMRIEANEISIRNALTRAKAAPTPDASRVAQLEAMLAPIPDPEASVSAAALGMVDRRFVMFSTEGNGRMIEILGSVRSGVPGVGVYVPGTSTNLNSSGSNHVAAWNLADRTGGPLFLYMEGDFPQSLTSLSDGAPSPSFASEMAPKLVEFGREVDREVSSHAPGTPVTYVGHSYGGSVVGSAEQLGLRADRILHASSAGTGVFEGGWNNPNPDVQRYSMTAPGDLIGVVQSYPDAGLSLPGVRLPGNPHASDVLGGDPDEVPGVIRLDTGYYGDSSSRAGEVVFGTDGHGKYWDDPGSTAFDNIVGVIAGTEATAYVERGIETPWVDVGLGDNGNGGKEAFDAGRAAAAQALLDVENPYADPRVTDNPQLGARIDIR